VPNLYTPWKVLLHHLLFTLIVTILLFSLLISSCSSLFDTVTICLGALTVSNIGEKVGWMLISYISLNLLMVSGGFSNKRLQEKETLAVIVCFLVGLILVGLWTLYMIFGTDLDPLDDKCDKYWALKIELTILVFPMFLVFNVGCVVVIFIKCVRDWLIHDSPRTPLLDTNESPQFFLIRLSFHPLLFFGGYIITFGDVLSISPTHFLPLLSSYFDKSR